MRGAVVIEELESDSKSVVAGDQEGECVEEDVSVAVVDGDGESAEADNLEIDRLLLGRVVQQQGPAPASPL